MMEIKVFKSANQVSILDVLPSLDYYTDNKFGEVVYKGTIRFLINEYGGSKLIKTAFAPKSEVKYFCREILANDFESYVHYGGSEKNGQTTSRIFSIKKVVNTKVQYVFEIVEGPGSRNSNGGYQMISGSSKTKVQKMLTEQEIKVMAGELLDFIHQSEMAAMLSGKPLFTILNNETSKKNVYSASTTLPLENVSVATNKLIVNIGGNNVDLNTLSEEQLSQIILNIQPTNQEMADVLEKAKFALANTRSKKHQLF